MSTYLRLVRYLKPHLAVFGLAIGCMAVSSLLGGIQLGAIFPLADRIVTNKAIPIPGWLPGWLAAGVGWVNAADPQTLLTWFALTIPVLFLVRAAIDVWQTFYLTETSQLVIRDLRQALFDKFMGLSLDYHKQST